MKGNKLKIITKVLAVLAICLISFVGVYVQKANRMENIIKSFSLSKDLKGYRQIILEISDATEVTDSKGKVVGNTDSIDDSKISSNSYTKTENKVNSAESLTDKNYEKSKSILTKRLKTLGVEDYNISLDSSNGKICILVPENDKTDHIVSNLTQVGNFSIKDSEDGTEYVTNNDLKKVSAVYNTGKDGTTVYLQIELNKNGKNILGNLSQNEYKTIANNTTENTTSNDTNNTTTDGETANTEEVPVEDQTENEATDTTTESTDESSENNTASTSTSSTQKKIVLAIDSDEMVTTSFDDPIVDGMIDLSMGKATTDSKEISDTLDSTSTIAMVLNTGVLPVTYKVSNNMYVKTEIINNVQTYVIIAVAVVIVAIMIYLVIKFKLKGFLVAISYIGFIALYLLLIRYTNVEISMQSITAILIVLVLNFVLNREMLLIKNDENEEKNTKKKYISFIIKMIPVFAISIIFSFIKWTSLNTFGMIMFWGIALIIIYNILITKNIVKVK